MGRELKRVPLDFAWPLNERWPGYVNHLYIAGKCDACDGTGYAPAAKRIREQWYGYRAFSPGETGSTEFHPGMPEVRLFVERNLHGPYDSRSLACRREAERLCSIWNGQWCHHLDDADVAALIAADRLWDLTRIWTKGPGWCPREPLYVPSAREVNLWSIAGMGHDSINSSVCVHAKCERLGIEVHCPKCDGEGEIWPSPEAKAAAGAWRPTDPPTGPGYQIWETVSEGSPISPVFSTPEALADHMAGKRWGADHGTPYETWLAFIEGPGWAPSMVSRKGAEVMTGVAASVNPPR